MALQEVARYPCQLLQSSSQQYCGPPLPALILPTSSCHLKLGGCSPPPGRQLSVLGVPPGLPAALVFADVLSSTTCEYARTALGDAEQLEECLRALHTCLASLSALLIQVDFPPALREKLLQCVSGILWTIHFCSSSSSSSSSPLLPTELLQGVHQELQNLYEHECGGIASDHKLKSKPPPPPPPPPPSTGPSPGRSTGRFSTYLQALLELVVAADQCCCQPPRDTQTPSPVPPQEGGDSDGRKKKSRTAKRRDWLVYVKRAVSLLIQLHARKPLPQGFYNCFVKSIPVRPQSRLLVVTGISPSMDPATAQQCILQLCNQHGGLFTDQLFLPTRVSSAEGQSEHLLVGGAVLELCSAEKCAVVSDRLLSCPQLQGDQKELSVFTVSDSLLCGDEESGPPKDLLDDFLRTKLLSDNSLAAEARTVLSDLFCSAAGEEKVVKREEVEGECGPSENLLHLFLRGVCGGTSYQELLDWVWRDRKELPLDGFLVRAEQRSRISPSSVWLGLFAVGYDLHFERYPS